MATLNAFRGGRLVADEELPGRNLYLATPGVFLVACFLFLWPTALAWAAAYLFWGCFAWGHLITFGFRTPTDRKMPVLQQTCMALSGGVWWLAMALRELLILPGLFLVAWTLQAWWIPVLAFPFALAAAGGRRLMWNWTDAGSAIKYGEIWEGVVWGVLIVFTYFVLRYA